MPLADFLAERIFKPLAMVDTSFYVSPEKTERLAQLYESTTPGRPVVVPDTGLIGDITVPTSCPSGGAGLVSTLEDVYAFVNCLLNNGRYANNHLLSPKTVALMTSNHIPREIMPLRLSPHLHNFGFGFGFGLWESLSEATSLTTASSYFFGGAAQTHYWIDPPEQFIGLMMSQHFSPERDRLTEIFQNLAYQAIVD